MYTVAMTEWTCATQDGQVSWGTKRSGSWARLWKGLKSWPLAAETSNQGDMQYFVWFPTCVWQDMVTRVNVPNKCVFSHVTHVYINIYQQSSVYIMYGTQIWKPISQYATMWDVQCVSVCCYKRMWITRNIGTKWSIVCGLTTPEQFH